MTSLASAHAIRESRELMAAVTDQKPSPFAGRCIYCSAHCIGRACRCHQDLLAIEREMGRAAA